ncbi:MAG: response regulator [Actinomycetota bacterium]
MARILVVDDEPVIRELIATVLTLEAEHDVTQASNGTEALEIIDADLDRLPDLVLLDLMMPEMDGWHFLETLYRRGLRKRTRVIVITGENEARQPAGTGSDALVLFKPFDVDALVASVNDALTRAPDEEHERKQRTVTLAKLISDVERTLSR